ncbi:hypothetical protein SMICM17S_01054 [Streptomyces microflavus]
MCRPERSSASMYRRRTPSRSGSSRTAAASSGTSFTTRPVQAGVGRLLDGGRPEAFQAGALGIEGPAEEVVERTSAPAGQPGPEPLFGGVVPLRAQMVPALAQGVLEQDGVEFVSVGQYQPVSAVAAHEAVGLPAAAKADRNLVTCT